MVVVYYTQTYFLDATLETIQSIKDKVELHILIELSPDSKKSTIIDIKELDDLHPIESCEKVLGKEKWKQLEKYFEGVASIHFIVHKNKRGISFASFKVASNAGKYIKSLRPDVVHFDTISVRAIGLYPYLKKTKVFVTIHDPMPHSGDKSWKKKACEFVFFRLTKGFFFYSKFASDQFKNYYPAVSVSRNVIRFQPFSFITQFATKKIVTDSVILFFGRLSLYKGIDLLLEAIPYVLKNYPNEKFIIAGNCDDYEIDSQLVERYKGNISFINTYLSMEELAQLIESAKFIICPYRDATQSGVLMTSYALGKMAIASNVGAFPEYIQDNINGVLSEPNAVDIAAKIIAVLNNEWYKELRKNINSHFSKEISKSNQECMLTAYQNE